MNNDWKDVLNMGDKKNMFLNYSDVLLCAPTFHRAHQIIFSLVNSEPICKPFALRNSPEIMKKIEETPYPIQKRYFAAWTLDQWEHAAAELRNSPYNFDESKVNTYKDDFINALHNDFESGDAYTYATVWYDSFPEGDYFNPARYNKLFNNEIGKAYMIAEYVQCGKIHPAIAGIFNYPKPKGFSREFVKNAGAFVVTYETQTNMHDILESEIYNISDNIAEMIGENEDTSYAQRIFIGDVADIGNGMSSCAVIYSDFNTNSPTTLKSKVKLAISESIPLEYWKKNNLFISTEPYKVTKGELDIAKQYLQCEPTNEYIAAKIVDEMLDETLLGNESKYSGFDYEI